jgi:hypothetical protein
MCYIYSFIPLARAECDNSLPFSGASSIPHCYVRFPVTVLHHLFFRVPSLHLAIYFLVYLLVLLFTNSYSILFWELLILYDMIYLLTAIGRRPVAVVQYSTVQCSTVQYSTMQYTFTHKQYTEQHSETEYTEQNIHYNKNT